MNRSRLALRPELLDPNGYLHAAVITAPADKACGYGTFTDLPNGAQNFTTIEQKSTFCTLPTKGPLPAYGPASTTDGPPRYGTPK